MNIDRSAICYTSMDSSQQALQINVKIFFIDISESFFN